MERRTIRLGSQHLLLFQLASTSDVNDGSGSVKTPISPRGLTEFQALWWGVGLLERGAYLKFFDRQRQNDTISMEFEMLRSFNSNLVNYCVM